MFRGMTQRIILGVTAVATMASNAAAAITEPVPVYTDLYVLAGVAAGVLVAVMLVRKALAFFR